MSGVGEYIVIAGERRLKAAQMLNQAKIKAIIAKDYSDEQVGYIQMAENMKRDDLRFYEMAEFIIGRIDAGEKQSTVADRLGISKTTVNAYMCWKDAPDFLKDAKDKFNSIRTFADMASLAGEYPEAVKDYLKDKEDFVTRANVKDLRKSIEEPEVKVSESQENAAAVITGEVRDENVTDSESLGNREDGAAENEPAVSEEEFSADAGHDDSESSETAVVSDDNEDSFNEKGDVADADLSNADDDIDHGFAAVSDETESDALSELNTEPKQERYKKPVIWGRVDGREAELLYREIPSADGLVKVRYEDGFEDEVLAEEFALNRICEA